MIYVPGSAGTSAKRAVFRVTCVVLTPSLSFHFIIVFLRFFIFKGSLDPMWGSNPQPQDQESHALLTEPATHPGTSFLDDFTRFFAIISEVLDINMF